MIFTKYLSDSHKEVQQLNIRRAKLLKELTQVTGNNAVVLTEELHAIDSSIEELQPLLTVFPCNHCGIETPVNQKMEVNFKSGMLSRGDDPAVFLDGRVNGRVGELAIRLCHACAIEKGAITPEDLVVNLLPRDKDGKVIHKEGMTYVEAERLEKEKLR